MTALGKCSLTRGLYCTFSDMTHRKHRVTRAQTKRLTNVLIETTLLFADSAKAYAIKTCKITTHTVWTWGKVSSGDGCCAWGACRGKRQKMTKISVLEPLSWLNLFSPCTHMSSRKIVAQKQFLMSCQNFWKVLKTRLVEQIVCWDRQTTEIRWYSHCACNCQPSNLAKSDMQVLNTSCW